MGSSDSYRVFISYSHENRDLAQQIVEVLRNNGLTPLWDEDFSGGFGFPEQIKRYITHSHVFLPIITEASSLRGWVHQEIGFAMALNIPVLPVAQGAVPKEMISGLHAVVLDDGDESRNENLLNEKLSKEIFEFIVDDANRSSKPLYECAEFHEDRTIMMADYAHQMISLGRYGEVRQKGALSSFHIPDLHEGHPDWQRRYGKKNKSTYLFKLLRQEHRELKRHAEKRGCNLIINPYLNFKAYGSAARKLRLQTLVRNIKTLDRKLVQIAIDTNSPKGENFIAVGDWFAAYSITGRLGDGYQQTVFTRHAPCVRGLIESFDDVFEGLLKARGWTRNNSREKAIKEINSIIERIK